MGSQPRADSPFDYSIPLKNLTPTESTNPNFKIFNQKSRPALILAYPFHIFDAAALLSSSDAQDPLSLQ
jgi:hypothetical protein